MMYAGLPRSYTTSQSSLERNSIIHQTADIRCGHGYLGSSRTTFTVRHILKRDDAQASALFFDLLFLSLGLYFSPSLSLRS